MITRFGRVSLNLVVPVMLIVSQVALMSCTERQPGTAVLVDDFSPQPLQGDSLWFYNRLGGDRGFVGDPRSGTIEWGDGFAKVTITEGKDNWIGVWTSLNHPNAERAPLDFSAIFSSYIRPQYQARITGLRIRVLDGRGTFKAELKAPDSSLSWSKTVTLRGKPETVQFALPPLKKIQNLNWLVIGTGGDFVKVDQVELMVESPKMDIPAQTFLWNYAMLLANWIPASGLTRDRANFPAGDFDNVSASGMQAAAAVIAWQLGFISRDSAIAIVTKTTQALLALPRCHGLWPHFVKSRQITPNTEWSSLDTIIAIVSILEALEALGLQTTEVEQVLTSIEWTALILPDGRISHGYDTGCSRRLGNGWGDFGTESWLANFGYAAATGNVASMDHTPPTYNGSGFIDELAWLLVPTPARDRWEIEWQVYRQQALARQLAYYQNHPCYGSRKLFGLSAAEVPKPSSVPSGEIYQAFGVGGDVSANDGSGILRHAVIVPHYAGMIASLHPDRAAAFWKWMEENELFTPLNNVESLMFIDGQTCKQMVWNDLKGSWNLSLQTLGWGRLLVGDNNPLYQGMWANDVLKQGYQILLGQNL